MLTPDKNGSKKITLYRRDVPLQIDSNVSENPSGIFDLSFIFDSSGSMGFEPFEMPPRGQYHFAALAFYCILKDLQERGIAPLIKYNLINYSNFTRASGWKPYSEIENVKRALFDYQAGGTILNPKELEKLRTTRQDNFISFMLTDSGFNLQENTDQVVREVEEMRKIGNIGFYLFQMGSPSDFSKRVEDIGFPVQYISSAEDFMNTTIRFTSDLYGRLAQNG
jgi:hypothetical protein